MTCVPLAGSGAPARPWRLWMLAPAPVLLFLILTPRALDNFLLLVAGTFVSEDLTCLAAAHAIRTGQMHWVPALSACILGILFGDLGLYAAGRAFSHVLLRSPRFARWRISLNAGSRPVRNLLFASRFLPGTRLPVYLVAGALRIPFGRFALWTFLAVVLWAPALVGSALLVGDVLARSLPAWAATAAAILLSGSLLHLARRLLPRLRRWEFWPAWLFYLPLVPFLLVQSLRHRSLTMITLANPGIPLGGLVGESKSDILKSLPSPPALPHVLLDSPTLVDNLARLAPFSYPLILKPNVGQRGAGVRLIHSPDQAASYLRSTPVPLIAQQYHPGPHEAGVFYYRLPTEPRGRIFSITHKVFPAVTGDGRSTLGDLVLAHPRYRLQSRTFLTRHADHVDTILRPGQPFQLALAGNHCQGACFLDGAHLLTPALEHAIDRIARSFPGFYIGRFDIRYADPAAFQAGTDFAIVELNGLTAESSNLYDPSFSLLRAYRILFHQWSLLYQIAAANRRLGHRPPPLHTVLGTFLAYWRSPHAPSLSD